MRRVAHSLQGIPVRVSVARRLGFTLLELLVVIFIIALLMSLLLPSLKRSMDLAKATACKSNLRQIGTALYIYRLENDGWLPQAPTVPPRSTGGRRDRALREPWFGALFPTYLAEPTVLKCPKDPFGHRVHGVAGHYDDPTVSDYASYGMNSFILTASETIQLNVERRKPSRPADTILLADIGPDRESRARRTAAPAAPVPGPERNSSLLTWSDGFDAFARSQRSPWVTTRHSNGIHVATLYGDVREVRTVEILKEPVEKTYPGCKASDCTFCKYLDTAHYSFARERLFWWTGPVPTAP